MYKIVNNNISITRGETATYNVKVIDKATGAPFILPHRTEPNGTSNQIDKFIGLFSVRRSDYITDGYAIKKFLWFCPVDSDVTDKPEQLVCKDIVLLTSTEIRTYKSDTWDNDYFTNSGETAPSANEKILYKKQLTDGTFDYRYYDANQPYVAGSDNRWIPYSFTIRFPFLYSDTAKLSPKSYKYSMTIYGGNNLEIIDGKLNEDAIEYKKPLVDANFIVEADINE